MPVQLLPSATQVTPFWTSTSPPLMSIVPGPLAPTMKLPPPVLVQVPPVIVTLPVPPPRPMATQLPELIAPAMKFRVPVAVALPWPNHSSPVLWSTEAGLLTVTLPMPASFKPTTKTALLTFR